MLDGEDKIVALAVEGNSSAFGALYDHYQPQIYRFVCLKVGRREEAEDLTHEVFRHAWISVGRYKHRGHPFSSWLYQIARNQVVDHYRSRRETSSLEAIDPESLSENTGMEEAERNLEVGRAMVAIKKLKPEYQDVLIFRFVEDMSTREVAGLLGKSEGAVKLLQHRALKVLREALGEEAGEETSGSEELAVGESEVMLTEIDPMDLGENDKNFSQ
ncbi:MAG: sigma-70 family RNA polymerase sigma factor [Candidatus Liptonbacteria bacterium]|nr:sigma-70 family RNA polymerase sigma factor [Candidatus Liptonbacteria bacterium]